MHVLCIFWRYDINTTAFCLGRYSLHLLLLKNSMDRERKGKGLDTRQEDRQTRKLFWNEEGCERTTGMRKTVLHKSLSPRTCTWRSQRTDNFNCQLIHLPNVTISVTKILAYYLPIKEKPYRASSNCHHRSNQMCFRSHYLYPQVSSKFRHFSYQRAAK